MVYSFSRLLIMSLTGGILLALLLLFRKFFGLIQKKKFIYYGWSIAIFFLLVPVSLPGVSVNQKEGSAISIEDNMIEPEYLPMEGQTSADALQMAPMIWEEPAKTVPGPDQPVSAGFEISVLQVLFAAGILYLIGFGFFLMFRLQKILLFHKYIKIGRATGDSSLESSDMQRILEEEKNFTGYHRKVGLYFHSKISSPMLTGIFRPKIYLPLHIPANELGMIFRHELIHAKRHDLSYRLLADILLQFHWFNPLVWRMNQCLEEDCELSCDERMTELMNETERKEYCKTILKVIYRSRNQRNAESLAFCKNNSFIERRVGEIMKERRPKNKFFSVMAIVILMVLITGAFSVSGLLAQSNPIKPASVTGLTENNPIKPASVTGLTENNPIEPASAAALTGNHTYSKVFSGVTGLKVHGYDGKLSILEGSQFKVTAANLESDYQITLTDGTLMMHKRGEKWTNNSYIINNGKRIGDRADYNKDAVITVYIPKNTELDKAVLFTQAGVLDVKGLKTRELVVDEANSSTSLRDISSGQTSVDSGSGTVIWNQSILGDTLVDSGSGRTVMNQVTMKNLSLDSGSGDVAMTGSITGKSNIDSGSGAVLLTLKGKVNDYKFELDTGSGDVNIAGKQYEDGTIGSRNAGNSFYIDSGSGNVTIKFDHTLEGTKETAADSGNSAASQPKNDSGSSTLPKDTKTASLPKLDKDLIIKTSSYDLTGITDLKLDFNYSNIHIDTTDEKKLTVIQSYPKVNNGKSKWKLEAQEIISGEAKNKVLTIKTKGKKPRDRQNSWDPGTEIYIYLPKDYVNKVDAVTNLGNIVVGRNIYADTVKLYSNLGNIEIYGGVKCKDLSLGSGLGSCFVDQKLISDKISIHMSLGDIELKDEVICKSLKIRNDLGDCRIEKPIACEEINIRMSLGTLDDNGLEAPKMNIIR